MKNLISKLKRKIIHKLGGLVIEDLPVEITQRLLNNWCNQAVDKHAAEVFNQGFKNDHPQK